MALPRVPTVPRGRLLIGKVVYELLEHGLDVLGLRRATSHRILQGFKGGQQLIHRRLEVEHISVYPSKLARHLPLPAQHFSLYYPRSLGHSGTGAELRWCRGGRRSSSSSRSGCGRATFGLSLHSS